jgi:hypothetical protein
MLVKRTQTCDGKQEAELTGYHSGISAVGKGGFSDIRETIGIKEWKAINVLAVCIQLEGRVCNIALAHTHDRKREYTKQHATHDGTHDERVSVETVPKSVKNASVQEMAKVDDQQLPTPYHVRYNSWISLLLRSYKRRKRTTTSPRTIITLRQKLIILAYYTGKSPMGYEDTH